MISLWYKLQAWIIGAAAVFLTISAFLLKAFLAGKASERAKQQADNLKAIRVKKQVQDETLSHDQLRKSSTRWLRDE